jgi:hypothetical protein
MRARGRWIAEVISNPSAALPEGEGDFFRRVLIVEAFSLVVLAVFSRMRAESGMPRRVM